MLLLLFKAISNYFLKYCGSEVNKVKCNKTGWHIRETKLELRMPLEDAATNSHPAVPTVTLVVGLIVDWLTGFVDVHARGFLNLLVWVKRFTPPLV